MSFNTDLEERRRVSSDGDGPRFRKTRWFFPRPGKYTIRVLEEGYESKYTHWVPTGRGKGTTIECLGDDVCPLCIDTKKVLQEHPEDYRNVPGFNPYGVTCYVNIFDRTLVKVCPVSGEENYQDVNGNWPLTSWGSGESLAEVAPKPSNKVKVFSRSRGVFNTIADFDENIRETAGLGITNYDLVMVVRPREGNTVGSNLSIIPQVHLNDEITLTEDLYDLKDIAIKLEPDEIRELQRGVSLRDIFAARRLSDDEVESEKDSEVPWSVDSSTSESKTEAVREEASSKVKDYLKKFRDKD